RAARFLRHWVVRRIHSRLRMCRSVFRCCGELAVGLDPWWRRELDYWFGGAGFGFFGGCLLGGCFFGRGFFCRRLFSCRLLALFFRFCGLSGGFLGKR